MDIESKFAKAFHNLNNLRPFYAAIYESMERIESDAVGTMGVSSKKIIYNKEFVDRLEFEELMFTNLHETAHVALMHVSRRKNRDPELWNIACDLYANKLLAEEFNILPGETDSSGLVKFLDGALYCGSIDTESDYAESIYESLYEQATKNGYNSDKLSGNQTGNNSDEQGSSNVYTFKYKGSAKLNNRLNNMNNTFKVELVPEQYDTDLMPSSSDQITQENDNKKVLQDARARYEMKHAGSTPGRLKIIVDNILKSHLDWKKLLRKFCIQATRTDTSFASPDKRMYYQSAIYPGQAMEENNGLKGVKICFDSSGSISMKDLGYFYGQVYSLIKQFKIDAEVIYWDAEVASCGKFTNFNELKKVEAAGGGGTDPTCLFRYFDSKECKVKPIVTVVFTDGYICGDLNIPKWRRRYKNTIWVMTRDYNKGFKPPFGQLAIARFSS